MNLIITDAAELDLESIADFVAQDSPRRAVSFVQELVRAAFALVEFPEAYPLIPDYEHFGLRRRPYGRYTIFYIVRAKVITIERILNAAQNYEAVLFPEV